MRVLLAYLLLLPFVLPPCVVSQEFRYSAKPYDEKKIVNAQQSQNQLNRAYQDVQDNLGPLVKSLKAHLVAHEFSEAQQLTRAIAKYVNRLYGSAKDAPFIPKSLNVYLKNAADSLFESHQPQCQEIFALRLKNFSASSNSRPEMRNAHIEALLDYVRSTREFGNFSEAYYSIDKASKLVTATTPLYLTNSLLSEKAELSYAKGAKYEALQMYREIIATLKNVRLTHVQANNSTSFAYGSLAAALYRYGQLSLESGKLQQALDSFRQLLLLKRAHYAVPEVNYAAYRCLTKLRPSVDLRKAVDSIGRKGKTQINQFLQNTRAAFLDVFWDGFQLKYSSPGGAPENLQERIKWCRNKSSSLD